MTKEEIPPAIKITDSDSSGFTESVFYEDKFLWERADGFVYQMHTDTTFGKTGSVFNVYCGQCYFETMYDEKRSERYCPRCIP